MTNYIIDEKKLFHRENGFQIEDAGVSHPDRSTVQQPGAANSSAGPSENHSDSFDVSPGRSTVVRWERRPPSGCSAALFWFSVIYWFFSLLCCAGALFIGWELGNTVREGISESPSEIRDQTARFFGPVAIPSEFKPAMSLTFKQPFSGAPLFFGAVYTYSNPVMDTAISDVITVGTFSSYLSEELRSTFQRRLSTQIIPGSPTEKILQESEIPVVIHGARYTFQSSLVQTQSGRQVRTISGLFRNAAGEPSFILMSADPQTVTPKQINQLLGSLNQRKD